MVRLIPASSVHNMSTDQAPKAVCTLTKSGKTTVIQAGTFPDCVLAMREVAAGFKKSGEAVAQTFSRDGRYLTDDGHAADYQRRLEADRKAASKPVKKKAAKKKAAKKSQ